jgi:signal transduction histidine kinase
MGAAAVVLWSAVTVPALVLAVVQWRGRSADGEGLARACHELRGPITAVRLGLQAGARSGELSPQQLRAIDQELGRAGLALDDLSSGRPRSRSLRALEWVDVGALLSDSVEAHRPAAVARSATIQLRLVEHSAHVWGDRLRLAQVTGNLIANAVEHGGATIDVTCLVGPEMVRIDVIDDGPGLPGPLPDLAHRARRLNRGRGRGLAIAMAIATEHRGRLTAAPSPRGARLVLELPLDRDSYRAPRLAG